MQNQETQDGSSSELPSSDELSSASSSMWEDSEGQALLRQRGFPAWRGEKRRVDARPGLLA